MDFWFALYKLLKCRRTGKFLQLSLTAVLRHGGAGFKSSRLVYRHMCSLRACYVNVILTNKLKTTPLSRLVYLSPKNGHNAGYVTVKMNSIDPGVLLAKKPNDRLSCFDMCFVQIEWLFLPTSSSHRHCRSSCGCQTSHGGSERGWVSTQILCLRNVMSRIKW